MKKLLFVAVAVCMLSAAAFGQARGQNYSGTWTLDASRSKLSDNSWIQSQILTVMQTEKDIKVQTLVKYKAGLPTDSEGVGRIADRGVVSDGTLTYSFDGKGGSTEQETPAGKIPVKVFVKTGGPKLFLTTKREFPARELANVWVTEAEAWELSPDGKTLTVVQDRSSRFGSDKSTLVFVKN